ncbi:MAG: hypothetical protein KJ011_09930 [Burkholderiaceae bacterium]|nr:hypothetical protein [Burkholderiaceae bacterium]
MAGPVSVMDPAYRPPDDARLATIAALRTLGVPPTPPRSETIAGLLHPHPPHVQQRDRVSILSALRQYLGDAMPGGALNPEITPQGLLDTASVATTPVPIAGDVIGLLADANRMYDQPVERTPTNVALAMLGLLPFMPSAGALGGKISGLLGRSDASKSASIYDPKPLPQRPFEHDYPNAGAAGGDGSGRVAVDVDGRPITAQFVAGRRTPGGMDEGLSRVDEDRIAVLLGIRAATAPRRGADLGGDFGRYVHHDRRLIVDQALPFEQSGRVFSHELGHALDRHVQMPIGPGGSKIPTDGLSRELRRIYEDLNTAGNFKPGRGATPKTFAYKGDDIDRELMAEAIRAYMVDDFRGEQPRLH